MHKKNILFLLTDQQRFDTIEALGNPIIRTPNLNRLVHHGVSFTKAYSPCPVCVPARFAMHTGKLPHMTDCVTNEPMPGGHRSFMQNLKDAGYQTHGVGKMHFTFKGEDGASLWGFESRDISEEHPRKRDDFKSKLESEGFAHVVDPHGLRSEMYYVPQPSQLPAHLHHSAWVTDRSIDFLRNRDADRPFFLMTSFIKPHPPFENPVPWNKLYLGPEMPLPKRPNNEEQLLTFWNSVQNRYKYKDQGVDDHLIRSMKAAYYGTISFVDYQIGRLLDYMEDHGILDDTLIVFTSDHGELLGDYNSFGKRCFLDSAARIPLIMKWPDGPEGVRCDAPVSLIDVFPTFMHFAGIDAEESLAGDSLLDVAVGKVDRDMITGQYHRGEDAMYMAVTRQYKYIYSAPDDREILLDHVTDPEETRNLANNPYFYHVTAEMKEALLERFKQDGFTEALEGDDWKRYKSKRIPDDPDAWLLYHDVSPIPNIPGYERPAKKPRRKLDVKI